MLSIWANTMLSDDKKALIEAEERYRQELSKKLSADLSATKKMSIILVKICGQKSAKY